MNGTRDLLAPVTRLTPRKQHCFFGYYDLPAVDARGRQLVLHVDFMDRLQQPGDTARLGFVRLDEPERLESFAETKTWNFQQGAFLQWLGGAEDTCVYNTLGPAGYAAAVHRVETGERRLLPAPVANVSRDGRWALSINFSRVYDFRPGYGYEEIPDPFAGEVAPGLDGVFLIDIESGCLRQILDYPSLVDFAGRHVAVDPGCPLAINHINFNPSASRFVFLLRYARPEGLQPRWVTLLMTAGRDGRDLRFHPCHNMASHYFWTRDDQLLFWMNTSPEGEAALVRLNDESGALSVVDAGFFRRDGHCSTSPDGEWILYDSYPDPDADHHRHLYLYSVARGAGRTLGSFRSLPNAEIAHGDVRCDLHPRWLPDGSGVTFDSIHEGWRGVYRMDLRDAMASF